MTKIAASAAGIFGGIQLGKGLFDSTIKAAANFQTTLKVLQATTGSSNADLKKLSATAIKLGADVHLPATSAASAADAMLQLGRAGFSTNQIIAASHGVLLLATAAEVDNATAADMVTKALGAFGLQAKDSSMVVNDFAGAANASQSSLQDVGDAMTQAGAGFHALRVPVADAATAIAEMAKQGITGGMAGAALNTAFTRLAKPTKAMQEVLDGMNVKLFDSNGKFVGLRSAIEQMSPKLDAMSDKQRLATISILGGTRGMKALNDVLGVGVKDWDATRLAVTRAGQAQAIANAKTSGFNGAMLALQNTLGTLALNIGIKVLPKVTQLVTWLGKIAAAPSLKVAVEIAWKGIVGITKSLEEAVNDALFGSTTTHKIVSHGMVQVGAEAVTVDPGMIAAMQDAISKAFNSVNWDTIATQITRGIGDATAKKAQSGDSATTASYIASAKGIASTFLSTLNLEMEEFSRGVAEQLGRGLRAGVEKLLAASSGNLTSDLKAVATLVVKILVDSFALAAAPMVGLIEGILGKNFNGTVRQLIVSLPQTIAGLGSSFASAGAALITSMANAAVAKAKTMASDVVANIKSIPGRLQGLAGDLTGALNGILNETAGAAAKKAEQVAVDIANAIKTAPAHLEGLAGDLAGRLQSVAGQLAGSAFTYFRTIGFSIADGVISGIGNLGSRIAEKVGGAAKGAVGAVYSAISGGSPSRLWADTIGASIGDGVVKGTQDHLAPLPIAMSKTITDAAKVTQAPAAAAGAALASSLGSGLATTLASLQTKIKPLLDKFGDDAAASTTTAGHKIIAAAKIVETPIAEAFKAWMEKAKANLDAQFAAAQTTIDSNLAKAKAKIDVFKAKATPTEALLAAQQAQAAQAQVQDAVTAAGRALDALKVKQKSDWADLLATQAANMASLKASVQATATTAFIAQHEVNKDLAGASGDPLAANLYNAHASLDNIIALFNQGQATQAQLLAAQDEYDAAVVAATDDTNAQKLDSDYVTWQGLVQQQIDGQNSIITQQQSDAAAQIALQQQFAADKQAAVDTQNQALAAQKQFSEEQLAAIERKARDAAAVELNTALVTRYNRIKTHLDNVVSATNANFAELGRMATKSGGDIGQNLAAAMRASIPIVSNAAAALAQTVSRYLKTNSPTEAGPMSDLDKWWNHLAPTLVASLDDSSIKAALSNAVTPIPSGGIGAGGQQTVKLDERVSQDLRDLVTYLKQNTGTTSPTRDGDVNVVITDSNSAQVYRSRR